MYGLPDAGGPHRVKLTWVQNLDLLEPHNLIPNGVWTFDDILRYGEEHKQCPYFTARRMVGYMLHCLGGC